MTFQKKRIEFVCAGNVGRSPVAELIARDYISRQSLGMGFHSSSSGTMVDLTEKILAGQELMPLDFMKGIITLANQRKFYTGAEQVVIEGAIRAQDPEKLNPYFLNAANLFADEELTFRADSLRYFQIPGRLKKEPEQARVRPDALAVFAIGKRNYEQIKKMYEEVSAEDKPTIIDIIPVEDAFGLGRAAYFASVTKLLKHVPTKVAEALARRC